MIKKGSHGEIVSKEMKEMQAAIARPSECKTTKMSPVECMKNGVSIDKAREMNISELTREDAEYLLQQGISKHAISKLYNTSDGSLYPKLTKWGLHHPSAAMSAKQRQAAFENDKPVLPPDVIPCNKCHANFKRVEMIDTHDRGMLCLKCYDETNNSAGAVPEEELREAINEIAEIMCAPSEEVPEPFISADSYALSRKNTPIIADSGERTEFDTGAVRDMHEGKGRYDLLPWDAIHELAIHCEQGALKYGERNCEKGIPIHSLVDSAVRHLSCYLRGQNDEPHIRAAVWNLCFVLYMEKNLPAMQDIPARLAVLPDVGLDR